MNKVYGIGLPRTGTTSLWKAMQILGWKNCAHYLTPEEWESGADDFDFICDLPTPYCYLSLFVNYGATAKFIYTYRPLQDWLDSFEKLWHTKKDQGDESWDFYIKAFWPEADGSRASLARIYGRHQDDVAKWRESLPILLYPLGSGWDPLCKFLGVPVPDVPYPHLGASDAQQTDREPSARPDPEGRQSPGPAAQGI